MVALAVIVACLSSDSAADRQAGCPHGSTLSIVAHQDDDLLFLNPSIARDVSAGRCVRSVFLTAGDSGRGETRGTDRERGVKAAYATMTREADVWVELDEAVVGHPISLYRLSSKPEISLAFLHLPDGAEDGSGFAANNYESLQKLWTGSITALQTIDGASSYTKQALIDTLASVMRESEADRIYIQDYVGRFGDSDHSDHHAGACFAHAAHLVYGDTHRLTAFGGYGNLQKPQNVAGRDLAVKSEAFYAYSEYDDGVCDNTEECVGTKYAGWLMREYEVASESTNRTQN